MKKQIIPLCFLVAGLYSTAQATHDHSDHKGHAQQDAKQTASAPLSGDSLFNTNASFKDQNGNAIKLESFRGHPVVISMAYTGCAYTCPMILTQMQQVEKAIEKTGRKDVQFVLITFDYMNDTPTILKAYAQRKNLSGNWKLLTSASDKEPREISNLLGIKYKKMEGGDYDHSFVITVLDSEGVIKGRQVGAKGDTETLVGYLPK
ncbi:SCO family protein [Bdellovibrio sp. ZAP7]|uniref:SCO family protein n=1 Tax=Bdellovibrio sp. ZAP7 TaxID=2231053 RepID=UPI0011597DDF|nr:SCO family protein [Bdellovibrio sp. ZAP7]QDK44835.1 SCO family protein [Bdellovibrio sp. ZAP7]